MPVISAFEAARPADKRTKYCFLNLSYSLFIFVLFNRFMVLVGFATAFRTTFCPRFENFHIKIGFVEPRFPKSVYLDI